jgi:hypothetical protein
MISFLGGLVVGFYAGILIMCIFAVSKHADERAEEMQRNQYGKPD